MRRTNRPQCTEAGTLITLGNRREDGNAWCGNCGRVVPIEWLPDKFSSDLRTLPRYPVHTR